MISTLLTIYSLYDGNSALIGWITNVQTLDREVNETYELTVIAHDLGDVSQSSMANVKVILELLFRFGKY